MQALVKMGAAVGVIASLLLVVSIALLGTLIALTPEYLPWRATAKVAAQQAEITRLRATAGVQNTDIVSMRAKVAALGVENATLSAKVAAQAAENATMRDDA